MGVKGAALATVLSQAVSTIWVVLFLCGKKTQIHIRKDYLPLKATIILPCIALGLAAFIMQASESIVAVCFNSSLLRYGGDIAVGAMTILTSVMQFAMLPLQGIAPVSYTHLSAFIAVLVTMSVLVFVVQGVIWGSRAGGLNEIQSAGEEVLYYDMNLDISMQKLQPLELFAY